jgi:hypothetical protein
MNAEARRRRGETQGVIHRFSQIAQIEEENRGVGATAMFRGWPAATRGRAGGVIGVNEIIAVEELPLTPPHPCPLPQGEREEEGGETLPLQRGERGDAFSGRRRGFMVGG